MSFNPDQRRWMPQHLDIGITDRCDLNCRYCYLSIAPGAPQGDMDASVCDLVLEYTKRLAMYYEPLQGTQPIHWNLFGGEPFVAFSVIQYLVAEAKIQQLPVEIEVYTNGAAATAEQISWCRKHKIAPKRSVGGCPEACAVTRPGSYLRRYEAATPLWDDWGTMRRVTLVPGTEQYLMRTLKYFYDRGYWGGIDFVTDDYADWAPEQIATLKEQITRLAHEFVWQFKTGYVMYNERLQIMGQWLFQEPQRLNLACGAGWGTQAITSDGYVVPCHRWLREPRDSPFCGGKLEDVLKDGPKFGQIFVDAVLSASRLEETDECRACSARYSCQHGCYHLSWVKGGDLKKTPTVRCEVYRHYIEMAKWVHAELAPLDKFWYLCTAERCSAISETA